MLETAHHRTIVAALCCLILGACITGKDPVNPYSESGVPLTDFGGPPGTVPGEWLKAKGSTFWMGSPANEMCREKRGGKETRHQVTLTRQFEISATEVTQGQFLKVRGYNPSKFTEAGANKPVEQVNWHEAVRYCNELSRIRKLKLCYTCAGGSYPNLSCQTAAEFRGGAKTLYACPGYRLPTEAEWELAYRHQTQGAFYSGGIGDCTADPNATSIAWYRYNAAVTASSAGTRTVGLKGKNGRGLYDMSGNVYEWAHDYYRDDLGSAAVKDPVARTTDPGVFAERRPLRGGGWLSDAESVRAAHRGYNKASFRNYDIGFRCVRTLNP